MLLIQQSVEKLGFRFKDIKILLISHAHFDHDAGSAKVKELTVAKYMVMDANVPVVESGGKADFFYNDSTALPAEEKAVGAFTMVAAIRSYRRSVEPGQE